MIRTFAVAKQKEEGRREGKEADDAKTALILKVQEAAKVKFNSEKARFELVMSTTKFRI